MQKAFFYFGFKYFIRKRMKIKYDINLMKFISLFENLTGAKVKDCILNESLVFVVEKGEIYKAIGKDASNIKKIEDLLKKKIRVIEFDDDLVKFVENLIRPIRAEEIALEDKTVVITDSNNQVKGKIIGRDAKNLKKYKEIVSRYFDFDDIVVR